MEALVRWRHPSRGLLQPSEFVPMAEETGLIVELGAWVLRRACADAAAWPSWLHVAVNVSPAQFRHREFVGLVEATLAETGLAAGRLELEVKEHLLLQQTDTVLDTMQRLRRLGVRLAMDDFGTGFASLGFLRRFPFDTIKIDGTFTRDLGGTGEAAAIVEVALSLCRSLHMTAIAEGVETDAQLQSLAALGCERVQGFHCGGPIPAKAVTERLAGSPVPLPIEAWSQGASASSRRKTPRAFVPAQSA
jgi:EAL domain-containing protein (putative c-di-GMP-specific phosphodiesterase class I)